MENQPPRPAAFRSSNIVRVTPGPTCMTQNLNETEDFFRYFLCESIIKFVALNTNHRLAEEFDDIRRNHEGIGHDVTTDEIYSYCGTLILLGVLKKRDVDIFQLFSNEEDNIHRVHYVIATFSRERFRMLSRYLTFGSPQDRRQRAQLQGKYFKMADVFSNFSIRFEMRMNLWHIFALMNVSILSEGTVVLSNTCRKNPLRMA